MTGFSLLQGILAQAMIVDKWKALAHVPTSYIIILPGLLHHIFFIFFHLAAAKAHLTPAGDGQTRAAHRETGVSALQGQIGTI